MSAEYDEKFRAQVRFSTQYEGYHPKKRFYPDTITDDMRKRYMLDDRKHYAMWRLTKKQNEAKLEREYAQYTADILELKHRMETDEEETKLYEQFWKEAPVMLPYQRNAWLKQWPHYYKQHAKCLYLEST